LAKLGDFGEEGMEIHGCLRKCRGEGDLGEGF